MKLSTQQLARLSGLLDEMIDADAQRRQQWLQALPAEHKDLETALQRALQRDEARAAFDGVVDTLPPLGGSGLNSGDLLGPYRLVRRLGAGGMAEVWLAQRADGAFQREVALKTPSRPLWRDDLAPRFAVERDILATLEHPHIARFYDAGVSPEGRPYVALEYVAGRELLQWADDRRLGIRARIELFLQMLQAVQHAHDQGVLHRDLKPRNVLVTETGQVKLLDFGVARWIHRPPQADLTQAYGRALTPAYASPEHLQGEPLGPASDVYSLGVVLHELLSGQHPSRASMQAPSARLDADAAAARGGSVMRIARALRGDLDAITLKALSPASEDRYDSAQSFARDLQRHLSGEAVLARPDSLRYRVARFVARHRAGVAQGAAAAVLVSGAVAVLLMRPSPDDAPARAADAAAPTLAAAPAALPHDKSIAVLPFADLSEQRDQEHFSDGLAEELIERLAHSRNLRVIARTSAFAFKGQNEDLRSIAARLGVAHLLTGSVRKSGEALRVTAQLVRAVDGHTVWSQTYERKLADLFKVQDDIAGAAARALEAVLIDRPAPHGSLPDIEAYNLVLRGEVYANGPYERDAQRAEVSFKQAIALDPSYALPWVKLALLYLRQADLSWMPKAEGQARARAAIDSALRIDPSSMAAHAARFRYLARVEFQWPEARAALDRMRAIDLRDALLLPECEAYFAGVTGNLDEAIKIQQQIVERDPLNAAAIGTLASYLLEGDRFEESLAHFRRELQMNPHAIGSHGLAGVNLALLGRGEDALAVIEQERHKGYRFWALAIAHWTLGNPQASDAALAELKRSPQSNAYWIARVHAVRGQNTPTFEWLHKACTERQSGCDLLQIDRFLRNLRDDPRYRALLVRLKLDGGAPAPSR